MPPRKQLNRAQRKKEIKFQVVRDENNQVVFRTLNAPPDVRSRDDLKKHLPKDFPMDLIEDNDHVQTRFSREGGYEDAEDAALAERLLKEMTLHDIGFDEAGDGFGSDNDFDYDNVDEVVDFNQLHHEFGPNGTGKGTNNRNQSLLSSDGKGDYAYDYNKHFKPMNEHASFFVPGVGITQDPEANQPIIPAAPDVDDEFEEDLKNDEQVRIRSEKIKSKVKKTIKSEVSGLEVPVFESSRYKYTSDFLHPLLDGDVEGYEELEDNIFELLLQSDDENAPDGDDAYDNDEYDDDLFGAALSRDEILAKMKKASSSSSSGGIVDIDDNEATPHRMSLADFGFDDEDDQQSSEKKKTQKSTKGVKSLASASSALKKMMKPALKTTTTTTTTTTKKDADDVSTSDKNTKKANTAVKSTKKGVSFSTKSVKSNGDKATKVNTKGSGKFGTSLGGYDDDGYDDDQEEEFNPDDMFGYGDDDDVTTSKKKYNNNDDDQDFGFDDDNDDQDFGFDDGNDDDQDFGFDDDGQDEDYYDEDYEDYEDDGADSEILAKMKSRILSKYSPEDDVTIKIESFEEEEEDVEYDYYDDGEGEFGEGDLDWYFNQMRATGGDGYDDEDDDEDGENYPDNRRGQNRDQDLTVIPDTDNIMNKADYNMFKRLVHVYEHDNSSDDDEYEEDMLPDEDDEEYMFHINKDGMSLDDPEVKHMINEYRFRKSKIQKDYQKMHSRIPKDIVQFIKQSIAEEQNTPQASIEDVGKEIDRQFAKKKKSRLDVQSMRTTLSTTANLPAMIKEVRVRSTKKANGQVNTKIIAEVTTVGGDVDGDDAVKVTTGKKKSVSFGEDQIAPVNQIKLDHRGIPIGVMEKHRQERAEKAAEKAAEKVANKNNDIGNDANVVPLGPSRPKLKLNFTQPISVGFSGQTQQFPLKDPDDENNDDKNNDDDEDYEEDEDEEYDEGNVYIPGARRNKKETPEERKLRKKLQKEHNATRRKEKKKTKEMYKQESKKAKQQEMAIKFTNPAYKKLL